MEILSIILKVISLMLILFLASCVRHLYSLYNYANNKDLGYVGIGMSAEAILIIQLAIYLITG